MLQIRRSLHQDSGTSDSGVGNQCPHYTNPIKNRFPARIQARPGATLNTVSTSRLGHASARSCDVFWHVTPHQVALVSKSRIVRPAHGLRSPGALAPRHPHEGQTARVPTRTNYQLGGLGTKLVLGGLAQDQQNTKYSIFSPNSDYLVAKSDWPRKPPRYFGLHV